MSGNHGMRGVYEGQDQKNFTKASLSVEQKSHTMNAAGYMPKDQARAMNKMRGGDFDAQWEERYKNDPLSRATAHGNQPSRGAQADAEIQADEAEILRKKNQ